MSDFYATMADAATSLLTRYGQKMTLVRTIPGTYDPVAGTTSGDSTTYADTIGAIGKITLSYARMHQIEQGDRLVTIDASAMPKIADKLQIGLSTLDIISVEPTNPGGTPVSYNLQVRGAIDDSADGGSFVATQATRTLDGGDFSTPAPATQPAPKTADGGAF